MICRWARAGGCSDWVARSYWVWVWLDTGCKWAGFGWFLGLKMGTASESYGWAGKCFELQGSVSKMGSNGYCSWSK